MTEKHKNPRLMEVMGTVVFIQTTVPRMIIVIVLRNFVPGKLAALVPNGNPPVTLSSEVIIPISSISLTSSVGMDSMDAAIAR